MLKTCVTSKGKFKVGLHRPSCRGRNLRDHDFLLRLGRLSDGSPIDNQDNFPPDDVVEQAGCWILQPVLTIAARMLGRDLRRS
jgi:hypothetical protein